MNPIEDNRFTIYTRNQHIRVIPKNADVISDNKMNILDDNNSQDITNSHFDDGRQDTSYQTPLPIRSVLDNSTHHSYGQWMQAYQQNAELLVALTEVNRLREEMSKQDATLAKMRKRVTNLTRKRKYPTLGCPAKNCTHTYTSNNQKHLKTCHLLKLESLTSEERQQGGVVEYPLSRIGMHPILQRHGYMFLRGAFIHHANSIGQVCKFAQVIFEGTHWHNHVTPDNIHTDKTSRVHLVVDPERSRLFEANGRAAIFKGPMPKYAREAASCLQQLGSLIMGRHDLPREVQLVYNTSTSSSQEFHMDSLRGIWQVIILPLNISATGSQASTKILDYNYMSPCMTGWEDAVPTNDWKMMPYIQQDLKAGDAISFCTQRVHAGPGSQSQTPRMTMFMAWPVDSLATINDTDEIVVTYPRWMKYVTNNDA